MPSKKSECQQQVVLETYHSQVITQINFQPYIQTYYEGINVNWKLINDKSSNDIPIGMYNEWRNCGFEEVDDARQRVGAHEARRVQTKGKLTTGICSLVLLADHIMQPVFKQIRWV